MLKSEQVYAAWAPDTSIWSPWVSPVMFSLLRVSEATEELVPDLRAEALLRTEPFGSTAFVLDLPGAESVAVGAGLLRGGYRLVPLFSGSPAPTASDLASDDLRITESLDGCPVDSPPASVCVVEMAALVQAMQQGTATLLQSVIAPGAPPVFLLDSFRLQGHRPPRPNLFDNRWMVFPQDLPSALFLRSKGIQRIVLVQAESQEPLDDLKHVLRLWQDHGLEIRAVDLQSGAASQAIQVSRPSRFKALWHRAMAIWGLRRNSAGGFGSIIPEPSSGGGFG